MKVEVKAMVAVASIAELELVRPYKDLMKRTWTIIGVDDVPEQLQMVPDSIRSTKDAPRP